MSTRIRKIKYPLDLTGKHPDNKVVNEIHDITKFHRAIIPRWGAFYAESLTIGYHSQRLVYLRDYYFSRIHEDAVKLTGKDVPVVIIIKNPAVEGRVYLSYQAVGGEFSITTEAMREVVNDFYHDIRAYHYKDILNKPEVFLPVRHLHHLHDIYGWTPIALAVEGIFKTLENGARVENRKVWAKLLGVQADLADYKDFKDNLPQYIDEALEPYRDVLDNGPYVQESIFNQYKEEQEAEKTAFQTAYQQYVRNVTTRLAGHDSTLAAHQQSINSNRSAIEALQLQARQFEQLPVINQRYLRIQNGTLNDYGTAGTRDIDQEGNLVITVEKPTSGENQGKVVFNVDLYEDPRNKWQSRRLDTFGTRIQATENGLRTANTKNDEQDQAIRQLQTQVTNITQHDAEQDTSISGLQDRVTTNESKVAQLETNQQHANTQANNLNDRIDQVRTELVSKLANQETTNQQRLDQLRDDVEQDHEALTNKDTALENRLNQLSQDLANQQTNGNQSLQSMKAELKALIDAEKQALLDYMEKDKPTHRLIIRDLSGQRTLAEVPFKPMTEEAEHE